MDFERFAPARDLLYLAALFFGAGAGCILNRWRRKGSFRFRNASISAGLCFFSGTAAALAAASIVSGWMIFGESALYFPLAVLAVIFMLAFRFPRAAGFPFFLALGAFVVWNGYICLRFSGTGAPFFRGGDTAPSKDGLPVPSADSGMAYITAEESGLVRIRLRSFRKQKPGVSLSFTPAGEDDVLEFRALRGAYSKTFPLVGGLSLEAVTEIRGKNEVLYTGSPPGGAFAGKMPFLSFEESSGKLETTALVPGAGLSPVFEKDALLFR